MCSLEIQFESFKKENAWAADMTFEVWERDILDPKMKRLKEQIYKLNSEDESDTTNDNI